MNKFIISILMASFCFSCSAQDISLPSPEKTGGKPLMEALNDRQTTREFSAQELDTQTLSNLLWAAYGFNREDKRTVPSANNRQEFIIYAVLKSGVYVYDAQNNVLVQKAKGDFRAKTGKQDFVAVAPLNLVYVVDLKKNSAEGAAVDSGFISQNVYLYCASAGLGTVVRGWFDKDDVRAALQLSEDEEPVLTQTVGYKSQN
ncbi:MAG: SagB/ThcOx family dehydrogenase [Dysgonamonadaceae bacterium]|jgi:SagB-type dehydrogenase family enzyme|nr:SagB/ThcOx family dehydrogenase [Dysgonamonadaceae bacterium]